MDCKDARPLIHEYMDASLFPEGKLALKGHLAACPMCRAALNRLEQAEALARALPRPTIPDGLADRIMASLPAPKRSRAFARWIRQHPAASAASVFLLVMLGSFLSLWNQDTDLVVKGASLDQLVIHGDTVYVPKGHTVEGNLLVKGGRIQVDGDVDGNLVVIHGSYQLASTAHISGQIRQVDQAIDWLWYKVNELADLVTK